jgi:hypothetical protein
MGLDYGRTDFTDTSKGLESPGTLFPTVAASTAKTYSLSGDNDGYPPRSIICHNAGNFICTDWNDNACTIPVVQAQVLPIMPKTISVSNAVAFSAVS